MLPKKLTVKQFGPGIKKVCLTGPRSHGKKWTGLRVLYTDLPKKRKKKPKKYAPKLAFIPGI